MVNQALVPASLYDHIPLWLANHGNNFGYSSALLSVYQDINDEGIVYSVVNCFPEFLMICKELVTFVHSSHKFIVPFQLYNYMVRKPMSTTLIFACMLNRQVKPEGSARTHNLKPHFVGLFFMY